MKPLRTLFLASLVASTLAIVSACTTATGPELTQQLVVDIQAARSAVDALAAAHHIDPAKVATVRAQADAAIALLATVGSVSSLADPKLVPAVNALAALNQAIVEVNQPPAAASAPAASAPG